MTDADGRATVQLPEWFEAANTDYRYQLTVIGQFAQAIIEEEIHDNAFVIRTDEPFVKVSWQVSGVHADPYAAANPLVVEVEKPERERGRYLHPEVYGQAQQMRIGPEVHSGPEKRAGVSPPNREDAEPFVRLRPDDARTQEGGAR
jgi:hypothetical protein